MSPEDAKRHIIDLKHKLKRVRGDKLRSFYIADICSLENFIHTYEPTFECGIDPRSFDYGKYRDRLYKEKEKRVDEILLGNELNGMLSTHMISEFEEADFETFIEFNLGKNNEKQLKEAFRDFMGSLGPLVFKKYNELIEDESIVFAPVENYGGICWDFPVLGKQVVMCEDRFGLYSYLAIAHEIGHAVHFHALNQVGRNSYEVNTFGESNSTLYETLYMDYLEKCGFDVFPLKNFVYSQKLGEAISIRLAAAGVKLGRGIFNGYDVVFDPFTLEEVGLQDQMYGRFYTKLLEELEYSQSLYYLVGEATTQKIIERNNGNAVDSTKDMLEFLLQAENRTHVENMEALSLQTYTFDRYALELKKYGHRPQK